MNIQLTLASRYLRGRRLRTVLTTLAIVFGVLVLFGMNTMLPAFIRAFQANVLAAAGQVDATITLKSAGAFEAGETAKVAAVAGVRDVSGLLDRTVNLPADFFDGDPAVADAVSAVSLVGVDPAQAQAMHAYILDQGRFLQASDQAAAVISASLAEAAGAGLGETLRLPSAEGETTLTVIGILPARGLAGNEEVLVPLAQAQAMLDMPGQINTIQADFDTMDAGRRAAIESEILRSLGESYQMGALASNSELLTNMKLAQQIFNVLAVLALLMGGFIIFNTFRTVVAERRRDIGMLRALGANRRTIFGVILAEGLVQGVIGTAVGLAAGYLLARGMIAVLSPLLHRYTNANIGAPGVSVGLLLASIALGIGVTLLAGLVPAISATHVTPLEALRPNVGAVSFRRLAGWGFWTGVAFIGLAVLALVSQNVSLIGLGGVLFVLGLILVAPALVNPIARVFGALLAVVFARSGTAGLAEGNLSRQPSRAAITASTTLIGMAIMLMAASLFTSVEIGFGSVLRKSLGSDYILVPPSVGIWGTNVGSAAGLADKLKSIDGVAVVSSMRYAPSQANGMAVSVMGIDPAAYPQVSGLAFSSGEASHAYAALASGRSLIANPVLASGIGVKPGDLVELITPRGPQTYTVAGIAGDYLNAKISTVYISQANIAADFDRHEDVFLQVNLEPKADREAAGAAIQAAAQPYPQYRVVEGRKFIDENLQIFKTAFVGIYGLVIFLTVPSLIAMVNTLAIGVIERTREIGMLRAVGATRRQVRAIVLAEALILAAIGTAFGILSGLYLGYMGVEAMASAGFPLEYAFPASGLWAAIAAGLFFGALAAIVPARQAARLEIVQALRYE